MTKIGSDGTHYLLPKRRTQFVDHFPISFLVYVIVNINNYM